LPGWGDEQARLNHWSPGWGDEQDRGRGLGL
jgi:hypothetical protein